MAIAGYKFPLPRKSKHCTPELTEEICKHISSGNFIETSLALAGLPKSTFYEWCKKAHAGEIRYQKFLEAVVKAEAESEKKKVGYIEKVAPYDWRAAAYLLEKRHKTRWEKRDKLELTGKDGEPVQLHEKKAVLVAAVGEYMKQIEETKDIEEFE